ncbi:MAG: hypothetical protein IJV83_02190 [Clostridia bacterium]|nr:hypothetical protein [Clostridia bacterium]
MRAKEVQEEAVTVEEFAKMLRALVRENLVGLTEEEGKDRFIFSLAGGTKRFAVCVKELA